jgi:phosphoribosylformylglycinamidine cyclo-ligase
MTAVTLTYAKAGVSIEEGDRFVREIKRNIRSTFTSRVVGDIGSFGGFFEAKFGELRRPVLVSSIDGVGTKLKVASLMGRHDTIGQDLVNHCVNDILVCGARPLFFLDYYGTGKLDVEVASAVVRGMANACRENGCALIGGETAEMPGLYDTGDYDLAGTIVGVVEKANILTGKRVRKGDVLLGLPSTGLHTNGYSLARAVLLREMSVKTYLSELGRTVGDALLEVHRSYLRLVEPLLERFSLHAMSHITGGGIVGNTKRVMPAGRTLKIDWLAWTRPPIFDIIQRMGDIPEEDMRRTFNLGIGLILVVSRKDADPVMKWLKTRREKAAFVGEVA